MRFLFFNFMEEEHLNRFETFLITLSTQTYCWPSFLAEDSSNTFTVISRAIRCEFAPLQCPSTSPPPFALSPLRLLTPHLPMSSATLLHLLSSPAFTCCIIPGCVPWSDEGIPTSCVLMPPHHPYWFPKKLLLPFSPFRQTSLSIISFPIFLILSPSPKKIIIFNTFLSARHCSKWLHIVC